MDALAAEYGQHPSEIRRMPMAEVLCYHSAILQRHDIETHAPSFAERDILAHSDLLKP